MKPLHLLILFITFCLLQACDNTQTTIAANSGPANDYGCPIVYRGDTINKYYHGVKQGHFVVFDTDVQRNTNLTKSPPDAVYTEVNKQNSLTSPGKPLEEGDYKDDKKQGVWVYYNADGTIKNKVEYKDDVPVNN